MKGLERSVVNVACDRAELTNLFRGEKALRLQREAELCGATEGTEERTPLGARSAQARSEAWLSD